jgi:hypothetical protein
MTALHYYRVETSGVTFTFIGGCAERPEGGKVWLCRPDGKRLLECPAGCVTEISRETAAAQLATAAKASAAAKIAEAVRAVAGRWGRN